MSMPATGQENVEPRIETIEVKLDRFIGDFEVSEWVEIGRERKSVYHEIWIPIVKRAGA